MIDTKGSKAGAEKDDTAILRSLMQAANISSYRALAAQADVSRWQVQQLRGGAIANMRVAAVANLASALNVSVSGLLSQFGVEPGIAEPKIAGPKIADRDGVRSQLQSEALQTIETWLRQWPTIAKRAQEKGDALPAAKILPFVKPIEQLMTEWAVEMIAPVDAEVPYDPKCHQLKEGIADVGELVRVTHTGRIHEGCLLHRAEVKRIS